MSRRWILALAVLWTGCGGGGETEPAADTGPRITMEDADPDREPPMAGAPDGWTVVRALVEPLEVARVSWEVPGTVAEVRVQVGDRVARGQILGQLETADREAKLAEARTLYRSARASAPAGAADGGPPPPELEEAVRRRLEHVQAAAKRTPGDRAAVQRAARREGEEAARDLAIAIGTVRNKGDADSRRAARRAGDTSLALAVLSELGTRVRNLEDAVAKSRLKSPMEGLVIGVSAQVGGQWNTRDPKAAFDIVDPASYVATASLPAERAVRFEPDEEAWVELPEHVRAEERLLPAIVHSVSSVDVPRVEDGLTTQWREVVFKLPSRLPDDLLVGDEVRVAFAP